MGSDPVDKRGTDWRAIGYYRRRLDGHARLDTLLGEGIEARLLPETAPPGYRLVVPRPERERAQAALSVLRRRLYWCSECRLEYSAGERCCPSCGAKVIDPPPD